jgi:hypothetical protein
MATNELIRLGKSMVQPFAGDPRFLKPVDCQARIPELVDEFNTFARTLSKEISTLSAGTVLEDASSCSIK